MAASSVSLDPEYLRQQARFIRDTLDPQVAQSGQDILQPCDVLELDELLRRIQSSNIELDDIRYSRMHLAIADICGRGTRWPARLIDRSEAIQETWQGQYGPLQQIGTLLYEPGGRLYGICRPEDLRKEMLLVKWLRSPGAKLSPAVSRRIGSLGFIPGDWWISPLFAHRAGIIDTSRTEGSIISDSNGAYAVVLAGDDEVASTGADSFQYYAKDKDPGRYRLTAATRTSRQPVRILRSHTLHSFWRPKVGIRYDGLYKVTGWTLKKHPKLDETTYIISFKRLATESSMEEVLKRPWTEEIEDYAEYKRIRQIHRDKQQAKEMAGLTASAARTLSESVSKDGAADIEIFEDVDGNVEKPSTKQLANGSETQKPSEREALQSLSTNR